MPDSTETLVYINAPTLDNADECTFVRNNDFLYATAGDKNRGNSANLVLYDKLINTDFYDPLLGPDIPRNTFNSGLWALQGSEAASAGDYHIGNGAQINVKCFNTGKLNKLQFKFFEKESINNEIQTLIKAKNLEDCNTPEEILLALSDYTKNPGFVTKVGIFMPRFVDNEQRGFIYTTDAIIDLENLPTDSQEWFTYNIEEELYITSQMATSLKCTLAVVFFTNEFNWNNTFVKGEVYSLQGEVSGVKSIRNEAYDNYTVDGVRVNRKAICSRSVPRGALDNCSYIIGDTNSTNEGITCGQNRLIEFKYLMEVDLVNEYLKDNSENHHLNMLDIQNLNQIRYSAPFVNSSYETKLAAINQCYISDTSITRNNNISCINKKIHSIVVPFKYSSDTNDYVAQNVKGNYFNSTIGGLLHTNRQLLVATEVNELGEPINWKRSENIIAYSYFEENMLYSFTFAEPLIYRGNGVYIKAARPVNESSGADNFAVKVKVLDNNSYYSFNDSDYVYFSNSSNTKSNCTPDIRILFDYSSKKEWFDYIESRQIFTQDKIESNNDYITQVIENNTTIINTYTDYISDRITYKWAEFCESHSMPLKGTLYKVGVMMSSNQWTNYENPVYLGIYEKNEDDIFVKKAVSVNSLIPRRATIEDWYFDYIKLSGKNIRIGLLASPDDILANLGETQNNPSIQTNAITGNSGYDGECYVCDDRSSRRDFSAPMQFFFDSALDIKDSIAELQTSINEVKTELENNINNIVNTQNEINTNINNNISNISNTQNEIKNTLNEFKIETESNILNIQNELSEIKQSIGDKLNLGKWRIYTDEAGNLIIDTEALAAAGKSIIFKDIE
jgi:hypothetical protein